VHKLSTGLAASYPQNLWIVPLSRGRVEATPAVRPGSADASEVLIQGWLCWESLAFDQAGSSLRFSGSEMHRKAAGDSTFVLRFRRDGCKFSADIMTMGNRDINHHFRNYYMTADLTPSSNSAENRNRVLGGLEPGKAGMNGFGACRNPSLSLDALLSTDRWCLHNTRWPFSTNTKMARESRYC
jgi:hypothetical protein